MCKYGTQNSVQVIELMSAWGPLIYVGCFAATLSSGIASLVGAPRVLQALAKDNLYPYIHVFAKGVGVNNDPIRGYGVVSVVSFICIMLGELNAVSSLLTNCFLASYSFINFSCFHATIAKSPGWRPSFKYYNSWLCLVGGLLCVVVMFLIDSITALITFIIALFLYKYVAYRKPDVNWGSSTQAQTYISSLKNTLDLLSVEEHVKNYRPQILLLSGSPTTRPTLVDFASIITKGNSLLCCANISKSTGFGQLRPNILMVGYKTNWRNCDPEELKQYFNTLHEALNMHFGVTILRVQKGFDYSEVIRDEILTAEESFDKVNEGFSPDRGDDESQGDPGESGEVEEAPAASSPPRTPDIDHRETENDKKEKSKKKQSAFVAKDGNELPKEILNDLMIFRGKQKGTIDVWWLYDDGGLTVLLPYILSTRSQWTSCKLRIFALANRKDELEIEQRSMINLLNKFRIDFSDMTILTDINSKASESVRMEFNTLIEKYKLDTDEKTDDLMLTEDELLRNGEKTNRNLRLRELLLENSKDASLIIMTLPIPRKNSVNASLYMAWLEMLSKGMPPFLFIRGNQSSVLTFYS
ncbi:Solute carrier family 12 member 1 [Armadillidium vulgare]|nr:Solute carrier family 12 member 1 [Armadillidium vulgare]